MNTTRTIWVQPVNFSGDFPLGNWIVALNSLQSGFQFVLAPEWLKERTDKFRHESGGFCVDRLCEQLFRKRKFPFDVMFVTSLQYEDGCVWDCGNGWSFLSLAPVISDAVGRRWMQRYFTENMVCTLEHVADIDIPFHEFRGSGECDTRGCPNDYCDDLSDLTKRQGKFCADCWKTIEQVQRAGRLSSQQLGAMLRLLDFVVDRRTCFTIMPFGSGHDPFYRQVLSPLVESCGFEPIRADTEARPFSIREDIIRDLYRADVVVADLTGKNPNVMYELGIAHALHKRTVILIGPEETADSDYREFRYLQYDRNDDRWHGTFCELLGVPRRKAAHASGSSTREPV